MVANKYLLFVLISFCSSLVYGQNRKYILTSICVQDQSSDTAIVGAKVILQELDSKKQLLTSDTMQTEGCLYTHFDKTRKYRVVVKKEGFYLEDSLIVLSKTSELQKQKLLIKLQPRVCFYVRGRVSCAVDRTDVPRGSIQIKNLRTNEMREVPIVNGAYEFCGDCDQQYQLKALVEGHVGGVERLELRSPNCGKRKEASKTIDIELVENYTQDFYEGETIKLPKLTFIGETTKLSRQGERELNRLVQIMTQMPDLWLSIKIQSAPYGDRVLNRKLVEKRARSLDQKLIDNGVSSYRYLLICNEKVDRKGQKQGVCVWKRVR
ncbi:MAG: hypothetical protein GY810_02295 [Aureispira sp.]|nr:hypothetical protein [Aureispira sp.]